MAQLNNSINYGDLTVTGDINNIGQINRLKITDETIYNTNADSNTDLGTLNLPFYSAILKNCIEFGYKLPSTAGHGGYIDFHYNGSTTDYTSRIIESAAGTISVKGKLLANSISTDSSISLIAHNSNEINFGGSNTGTTIHFGYRAVESRPKPSSYIFNGSVTATGGFVGVNADCAECFDNKELSYIEAKNRIVELDDDGFIILAKENSKKVIGIVSNNYAMLLGGTNEDVANNKKIPIGLAGTLYVESNDSVSKDDIGKFVVSRGGGTRKQYCRLNLVPR